MPAKKLSPPISDCTCVRVGYALYLCQAHAPIPYELTDRGRRDVRHMRQWDAIKDGLVESNRARAALTRAANRAGRSIEARVKRNGTRRVTP